MFGVLYGHRSWCPKTIRNIKDLVTDCYHKHSNEKSLKYFENYQNYRNAK